MNRRTFLAGLLAAAAVPMLRADRVLVMLEPLPPMNSVTFTSYFKWNVGFIGDDWRHVARLVNIDVSTSSAPADLFAFFGHPTALAA